MSKLPHALVDFEHPAEGDNFCAQCTHYQGFKCAIVADPVRPEDWCEKFKYAMARGLEGVRKRNEKFLAGGE